MAAMLVATPALAQPSRARPEDGARAAAAVLGSPITQDAVAATVARLADILLDTKVGPLAALTDPDADIRPNDTLGDVKRRDDPDFDRRLYADTRHAVAVVGAAAGSAAVEAASIRRTADRLREALAPLAAALPADR